MLRDLRVEPLIRGVLTPEGPAFDRNGRLHFVSWENSSVLQMNDDGTARELLNTGGIPAGLAFGPGGVLYIADEGKNIHGVLTVAPGGKPAPFVQTYRGQPLNGANDLSFDARGVLYFSDPWGSSLAKPVGGFYRVFPDGRLEQIDSGLAFPNGVAVNAQSTAVFLAETGTSRVYRYQIEETGAMGARTLFATLSGGTGPDGMAFDSEGGLYVAHYGAGRVDVISPGGEVVDHISVPGAGVTNVAFGGADLRLLVITEVETQSLYQVRLPVAGQRLHGVHG